MDSAREELRIGRHWHAARLLRAVRADTSSDPALRLLIARAEAGWGNWTAAASLLGGSGGEARPGAHADELHLLGRALEESGRHEASLAAYGAFLRSAGRSDARRVVALVRMARMALAAGRTDQAIASLGAVPPFVPAALVSWAAAEGAEEVARRADTMAVGRLLTLVSDAGARDAVWDVPARARLAVGDTLGAEGAYRAVRASSMDGRRADAATEAGRLALARGDSARARPLLVEGLASRSAPARTRARAAAALLSFRDTDLALTLRMAAALEQVEDRGPALGAYDRAARLAADAGTSLSDSSRLARARLMATVTARHQEALKEFRSIHASPHDPAVGSRNLELWARLRARQGRSGDAQTLRGRLLEEYPSSAEAAELLWERAQQAEERGDADGALAHYATLATHAPEHARSGQARMRSGQILLGRGRTEEAARAYEAYLEAFPDGRRWEEASYWAAAARRALGQDAAARRVLARLRRDEPVSYYAVMAADLVGEAYTVSVPQGAAPARPTWLEQGLAGIDLLLAAGLTAGVEAEEARLAARARPDAGALLALAEALVERGRMVAGITLGWELREAGAPLDQRLVGVLFPLPYREMIERQAAESRLDPILVAALIRQESAFEPAIRSPAGAVGLMQVMPATGRELARRLGPSGFREGHLEVPEVNLHLGAAFYADMSRRYGTLLPLVLAAYNAGPARANRWGRYPEASSAARLTERIPFDETRTYVKNVVRNLAVYRALYGRR